MSSEILIQASNLSKCYRLYSRPEHRLKQFFFGRWRRYFTEFWALRDVSFSVKRGESVGIVGRNGAGKSTLLQILAGTLSPTDGAVEVHGRISALLELGMGFNTEFTGRENVYLNGAILGLRREEIEERYDRIVAFADIGQFIDQPVKTYSSGMFVRLAFAIATEVDPDLLIVDEALAVGDAKFQTKCFRRFEELRAAGKSILFVTHATEQMVRHCDHAILLDAGRVIEQGEPKHIANTYLDLLFGVQAARHNHSEEPDEPIAQQTTHHDAQDMGIDVARSTSTVVQTFCETRNLNDNFPARPGYSRAEFAWGNREAELVDYLIVTDEAANTNHFDSGSTIDVYVKARFHRDVSRPIYGLTVKTPDGITVYGTNSRDWGGKDTFWAQGAGDVVVVRFQLVMHLVAGHYILSLGLAEHGDEEALPLHRRYDAIELFVRSTAKNFGITDLNMSVNRVASYAESSKQLSV